MRGKPKYRPSVRGLCFWCGKCDHGHHDEMGFCHAFLCEKTPAPRDESRAGSRTRPAFEQEAGAWPKGRTREL